MSEFDNYLEFIGYWNFVCPISYDLLIFKANYAVWYVILTIWVEMYISCTKGIVNSQANCVCFFHLSSKLKST